MEKIEVQEVLTRKEYKTLIEAGYSLESYSKLCVIKSKDPFYRNEYERMLRAARNINEI